MMGGQRLFHRRKHGTPFATTKQGENALGVARTKGTRMDWKYLFEQAETLGIVKDLEQLRDEAGI